MSRKQYRVVVHRLRAFDDFDGEVSWSPRKAFSSRAAAIRYAQRFGPEPWKAWGYGPDDHWCESGDAMRGECGAEWNGDPFSPPYKCKHPNRTCREAFKETTDRLGEILSVEIQERTVSPWATTEKLFAKEGE